MKIGLVGAGNIGSALAAHFTRLGHEVRIANSRGPDTLRDVEKRTGAKAVPVEDAIAAADLVVVTVPMKNVPELPAPLFRALPATTPLIDTCNYYPDTRDGTIRELEGLMPESSWVQAHLGHPVVKAFNNIIAPHLANRGVERGAPGRIALPIAGDDASLKRVVLDLVDAMGFDPIDAGPLSESWRQQQGMPVYCTDNDADGVRSGLARADHDRLVEMRKQNEALMKKLKGEHASADDIVRAIREMHAQDERRKAG